jgi:hypothetical protein
LKRLIFLFATAFMFLSSAIVYAQKTITWEKDLKLEWSDFKAKPNTELLAFAETKYTIEILPNEVAVDSNNNVIDYQSLTVVAIFYCELSWVYQEDDFLLAHEQLHFDIAALYAQKMRTKFEELKKQKIADFDLYAQVYQDLWKECSILQKQYDKETNHGLLREENKKWTIEIRKQLD